jgi:hypothetical protein
VINLIGYGNQLIVMNPAGDKPNALYDGVDNELLKESFSDHILDIHLYNLQHPLD